MPPVEIAMPYRSLPVIHGATGDLGRQGKCAAFRYADLFPVQNKTINTIHSCHTNALTHGQSEPCILRRKNNTKVSPCPRFQHLSSFSTRPMTSASRARRS